MVTAAVLWSGLASLGAADDQKAAKSPDNDKAKATASAIADLRVEIHRTLAALNDARLAEEPDQARLDELTQKLQQLRGKLRAENVAAAGNRANGWACPWGGPGWGFGRQAGWGGPGFGPGMGRGAGFGPGMGRGPGFGRGFGPGAGQGLAPGGPAYVDEDHDGVCDNFERRHTAHP
jgi:hypothetical protein